MMLRTICLLIVGLPFLTGCGPIAAQLYQPVTDTLLLPLGNSPVQVHRGHYGDVAAPFFVHLHHNEQTADSAAQHLLQRHGGTLLTLHNNRQRLVQFDLAGVKFQFDPNRMFTAPGARQSLQLLGPYSPDALASLQALSDTLLSLLPDSIPLIAVHNNTNGAYSLLYYLLGASMATEAAEVFRNAEMDPDDFVLTTDSTIFNALKSGGINAVLQQNETATDDGSLGFVWGTMGRSYTNVEAQHGHWAEQVRMIEAVIAAINQPQSVY